MQKAKSGYNYKDTDGHRCKIVREGGILVKVEYEDRVRKDLFKSQVSKVDKNYKNYLLICQVCGLLRIDCCCKEDV